MEQTIESGKDDTGTNRAFPARMRQAMRSLPTSSPWDHFPRRSSELIARAPHEPHTIAIERDVTQSAATSSTSLPVFSPANSRSNVSGNALTPPPTMSSREITRPSRIQAAISLAAWP
jgi:hypothetical protein